MPKLYTSSTQSVNELSDWHVEEGVAVERAAARNESGDPTSTVRGGNCQAVGGSPVHSTRWRPRLFVSVKTRLHAEAGPPRRAAPWAVVPIQCEQVAAGPSRSTQQGGIDRGRVIASANLLGEDGIRSSHV